ncbi:hypothetical protein [Alteromonas sp. ASW11-130]|uniref:hypothetical protein n=1 Tax=Alteromonas sp. ASW11-130 TaxID=3015775 RepID=UPI0022425EE1|nr:hypothetical protein [Alteromonas sp. ASW11-130]MCW8091235.1 hypothetical protein [Alteromonas sp. ASW11-130]
MSVLLPVTYAAAQTQTYVIGAEQLDYYPHFDFARPYDKGFAWKVLQRFATKHNIKFKYISLPPKRLKLELQKGTIDFAYPDNPRWEQKGLTRINKVYSQGLALGVYGTMVQANALGNKIDKFRRLAYPNGFTPVKWEGLLNEYNIETLKTYDAMGAIRAVLRGRADGADIEFNVATYLTSTSVDKQKLVLDPELPFSVVHFSLSTIAYPKIIEKLDTFLIEEKDFIDELKAHYRLKQSIEPTDYSL